jgi:hypothetical protein
MYKLVALVILLTNECFIANMASELKFASIGVQMRSKIIGTGEKLETDVALEGCGCFCGRDWQER